MATHPFSTLPDGLAHSHKQPMIKHFEDIFQSADMADLNQQNSVDPINQHPARAGYDTRSIFKRSLTSLISEFSFS